MIFVCPYLNRFSYIVRCIRRKSDCVTYVLDYCIFSLTLPSFQPKFCLCLCEVFHQASFDRPNRPPRLIRVRFSYNVCNALTFEEVLNLLTAQCSAVVAEIIKGCRKTLKRPI